MNHLLAQINQWRRLMFEFSSTEWWKLIATNQHGANCMPKLLHIFNLKYIYSYGLYTVIYKSPNTQQYQCVKSPWHAFGGIICNYDHWMSWKAFLKLKGWQLMVLPDQQANKLTG